MVWGSSFDKKDWPIKPIGADKNTQAWNSLPSVEVAEDVYMPKPNVFSPDGYEWSKPNETADAKLLNDVLMQDGAIHPTAEEMAQGSSVNWWYVENGEVKTEVVNPWPVPVPFAEMNKIIREHTNKVPTHDPYTNPNAHIYYECNCGQMLDPGTKRFAELNNCASKAGWKIRFSDNGYIPYCVECGKGVE